MSRKKLAENLREYADIAEAGEKSHWALAMRQAAEYIRADLEANEHEAYGKVRYIDRMARRAVFSFSTDLNGNIPEWLKEGAKVYTRPQVSKREESYSDALRSLASYVGCGGYNADDPIDAKEFEERIRFGIDLMLSTAQSQPCARKPFTDFC